MQYLEIGNLEWDENSFVGKRTTRATQQKVKIWKLVGDDFLLILEVQHLNTRNRENHQTRKLNK